MIMDLVPAGIMEKRPFLRLAGKGCFGQKTFFFNNKKHPKFHCHCIVVALVRPLYVSLVYIFAPVSTYVDKRKIKIWVNSKIYT